MILVSSGIQGKRYPGRGASAQGRLAMILVTGAILHFKPILPGMARAGVQNPG
jgi:hypothetical protein